MTDDIDDDQPDDAPDIDDTADTDADEDRDTDTGAADTRGAAREPRTVPAGLFVLAVLVAGVFAVLAVVALSLDGGDDDGNASEARTAAGDYAERFLALSHESYDAWLEDMRSIGTAGFAESVGRREAELQTLLEQSQVSWEGNAVEVYLTQADDELASAVVLYDLTVTDTDGTRTIPDQYLRVDLVEGQDGWLVERILSITSDASSLLSGADRPPGSTSGTTSSTSEPAG